MRIIDFYKCSGYAQVCAGHLFYLIGGLMPQSFDEKNDCKFALLGWDHHTCSFPSAAAFQCTEILEWVNGAINPAGKIIAFQPYKLLYACKLQTSECFTRRMFTDTKCFNSICLQCCRGCIVLQLPSHLEYCNIGHLAEDVTQVVCCCFAMAI